MNYFYLIKPVLISLVPSLIVYILKIIIKLFSFFNKVIYCQFSYYNYEEMKNTLDFYDINISSKFKVKEINNQGINLILLNNTKNDIPQPDTPLKIVFQEPISINNITLNSILDNNNLSFVKSKNISDLDTINFNKMENSINISWGLIKKYELIGINIILLKYDNINDKEIYKKTDIIEPRVYNCRTKIKKKINKIKPLFRGYYIISLILISSIFTYYSYQNINQNQNTRTQTEFYNTEQNFSITEKDVIAIDENHIKIISTNEIICLEEFNKIYKIKINYSSNKVDPTSRTN